MDRLIRVLTPDMGNQRHADAWTYARTTRDSSSGSAKLGKLIKGVDVSSDRGVASAGGQLSPIPALLIAMLLILIPLSILWLVVTVVVIAACRMAALGDAPGDRAPRQQRIRGAVRERIVASPQGNRLASYR